MPCLRIFSKVEARIGIYIDGREGLDRQLQFPIGSDGAMGGCEGGPDSFTFP